MHHVSTGRRPHMRVTANHGGTRMISKWYPTSGQKRPRRGWIRGATTGVAVAGGLLLGTGGAQAAGPGPADRHTSRVYLTVSPETPKEIPGGNVPFKRQTAPGS